jgi:uncharacterized protein
VFNALKLLDKYHGQATGMFTCDEHLAGRNPSQGTELCTVVETMFSLEVLLSILGDPELADRLERITFNALPATFKPDMCAHQYDQQCNQVVCKLASERIYVDNGPDSNLFGLEPNYGCCTANMHQGWPKFTSHLWMRTPDDGLAVLSYAPCTVETQVKGKPVRIEVKTDYPFDETVNVTIHAQQPVEFELRLQVPEWTNGMTWEYPGGTGKTGKGGGDCRPLAGRWRKSSCSCKSGARLSRLKIWLSRARLTWPSRAAAA